MYNLNKIQSFFVTLMLLMLLGTSFLYLSYLTVS